MDTTMLLVGLILSVLVVVSVAIHWEALIQLSKLFDIVRSRWRMMVLMLLLVVVHVLEIHVFALTYYVLDQFGNFGTIVNASEYLDFVYYSAAVYTTLGFGDLLPLSHLRMITAIESLLGLALITWSASFTYLKMSTMFRRYSNNDMNKVR